MVHGREFQHPDILARGAMESFEEYKKANQKKVDPTNETIGRSQILWTAPSIGMYIVNWDATLDPSNMHTYGHRHCGEGF